jgi:hypothetical protein
MRARFRAFHKANPNVYKLFRRFARQARDSGRTRWSARDIVHRIRWFVNIETVDAHSDFKINDHYSPYYARLLVKKNPSFAGFFEMRELKAK